jgi:hypothetical protein
VLLPCPFESNAAFIKFSENESKKNNEKYYQLAPAYGVRALQRLWHCAKCASGQSNYFQIAQTSLMNSWPRRDRGQPFRQLTPGVA